MFRRSPRRTLESIVTKAIAGVVPLAGSHLKRFVTKQAQSKSIELPGSYNTARGGIFLAREVAVLIKKAARAK
jgi:hypothetical protein